MRFTALITSYALLNPIRDGAETLTTLCTLCVSVVQAVGHGQVPSYVGTNLALCLTYR